MIHTNLIIHGKVHGVFFRQTALEKAQQLNIKGTARNMPNGTVFIEAQSESLTNMQEFTNWCRKGPRQAEVTDVVIFNIPETENTKIFTEFTIE